LNKNLFSLSINHYPDLKPMVVNKTYEFKYRQKDIKLNIKVDTIANLLLKNYPFVQTINYLETPFTETTRKSLLKAFQPHLKKLEVEDQMEFLISFTRKAFEFENDQVRIGRDQPLTAEETLVASTSDFEDRTAVFYHLLKEVSDLNFVVVQYLYDDIVTIGVELPEVYGDPFIHEGIHYTICDPTMPTNTSKLGIYPINLDKDIAILETVQQAVELGMRD